MDEYQDVNPAQERLIELLTGPQVELCVVGDDQQAIYQWRGSDVSNIVTVPRPVPRRWRRSRSRSTGGADRRSSSRQPIRRRPSRSGSTKTMAPHRPRGAGAGPEVVVWSAPTEVEEAGWIANLILDLADKGAPFRDIAVLVRSRAAYPRLVEQFATFGIPVQPGGRSGLFDQPEAVVLGHTFAWLSDIEWRDRYGPAGRSPRRRCSTSTSGSSSLSDAAREPAGRFLRQWKAAVPKTDRPANLIGEFYELLDELAVRSWDLSDPLTREPARHPRPVLLPAGRLRVGAATSPARP